MTPEDIARMEVDAQRILGKSIMDCTAMDLMELRDQAIAEAARLQAEADRGLSALRDVAVCGCKIRAPRIADGSPDIGRGVPEHTCGRS